jgi:hypothetical protein
VVSSVLDKATVHFINYCDPGQHQAAKAAAKKDLSAIVAKHGGAIVAATTPSVRRQD